MNKLFYGDNLDVLRDHIASESVDLIYLDPPFNSNANYNILFKSKTGDGSDAQIEAFDSLGELYISPWVGRNISRDRRPGWLCKISGRFNRAQKARYMAAHLQSIAMLNGCPMKPRNWATQLKNH